MTEADAALVARARRGDTAAFETLLRRYFRVSFLVAYAALGNRADAEDVCQDAFFRSWQRLGDCREPARFGAWLVRIVRNQAHNRRDYLGVRVAESLEEHELPGPENADAQAVRTELGATLARALARLTPVAREVVLLHDLEGWRHAEIAVQLELSEAMSRRHLSDARKRLRELLGDHATLSPDHD